MRYRRGPGKCNHLNMFDQALAHECVEPDILKLQGGTNQRCLQQGVALTYPSSYIWISTPCLLLNMTVTLLHVLPLLILASTQGQSTPIKKKKKQILACIIVVWFSNPMLICSTTYSPCEFADKNRCLGFCPGFYLCCHKHWWGEFR